MSNPGLLCTIMFKYWRFLTDNVICEIMLTFLFGALAYAACELLDYSGVIAVLVCGIVMAHFNFYNLSKTGQLSAQYLFGYLESPLSSSPLLPSPSCLCTLDFPPGITWQALTLATMQSAGPSWPSN